jgi:type IV pilus assembly protein PilA
MSKSLKKNVQKKRRANKSSQYQCGFLLLEFIISLFIISVLCVIAIPIYQTYLVRAKMSEVISLTGDVKFRIAEYYSYYGHFPANSDLFDIVTSGSSVGDISINSGAIVAKFRPENEKLKDFSLSVRPALAGNEQPKVIRWTCGYAQPPAHFIIQGENQTDIPPDYLVSTCR